MSRAAAEETGIPVGTPVCAGTIDAWAESIAAGVTHPGDLMELKNDLGISALEANGITGLYRIGDCEAPRTIADCIFDGHRLAREIDSDDPSTPLPFVRERSWVTASPSGDLANLAATVSG